MMYLFGVDSSFSQSNSTFFKAYLDGDLTTEKARKIENILRSKSNVLMCRVCTQRKDVLISFDNSYEVSSVEIKDWLKEVSIDVFPYKHRKVLSFGDAQAESLVVLGFPIPISNSLSDIEAGKLKIAREKWISENKDLYIKMKSYRGNIVFIFN